MEHAKGIGALLVALLLFAVPGYAEDDVEYEGVPAYSVARLKVFEGSAWVRTPDSGDWEEFPSNSPVPERSLISIPEGSEAELQFHGGQFVLLTEGTELYVRDFGGDRTAFRLRSGEIRFYLPEYDFAPVLVSIPAGRDAEFRTPGKYWLTVDDDGETTLVVREGEGSVTGKGGDIRVREGEIATIDREVRIGKYSGEEGDSYEEPAPLTDSERQANVPPAAAYELREYGEWVHTPEYGYVWKPRVSPDWSPYYYGRWAWVSPYGWTWISYEPWGWYPYHYGYWYFDPVFAWVWYPFRSFVSFSFFFGGHHFHHFHRHVHFVPANVRFVRDGHRVRWVPLRPGERTRRIVFTRSDARLRSWERPLERGSVFVRSARKEGSRDREWRDWSDVRRERRKAGRDAGVLTRMEEGRRIRGSDEARPVRKERAVERSLRGRDDRTRERIRDADRSGRERPERPERWRKESPRSLREDRRSEPRMKRSGESGPADRYRSGKRSERVSPPGRTVPRESLRSSPRTNRGGRDAAPRWKGNPGGRDAGRDAVRRSVPKGSGTRMESTRGGRGFSSGKGDRLRWDSGRGRSRGSFDFGNMGGRGGRSVR